MRIAGLSLIAAIDIWGDQGVSRVDAQISTPKPGKEWGGYKEVCRPCEDIFPESDDGVLEKNIKIRGEPKSGTGFLYTSSRSTLRMVCGFLNDIYGADSCTFENVEQGIRASTLVFIPSNGKEASCPCSSLKRVEIRVVEFEKHALPLGLDCAINYASQNIIARPEPSTYPCPNVTDAATPEKKRKFLACLDESLGNDSCSIVDESSQLAIIRDPRAAATSLYFMGRNQNWIDSQVQVDSYVLSLLSNYCQRTMVRNILFGTVLRSESLLLFYEDVISDESTSFRKVTRFFGMNLPEVVIKDCIDAPRQIFDLHVGGRSEDQHTQTHFTDEIDPETLSKMDEIMRSWLSPELLIRWNVDNK